MKEIMDTSLVEGYIFFFEVLDMVGKECQHLTMKKLVIGRRVFYLVMEPTMRRRTK